MKFYKTKWFYILSRVVLAVSVVAIILYLLLNFVLPMKNSAVDNSSILTSSDSAPVVNPVDFPALKAQNKDIIAWIKVDGTDIDEPVLMSAEPDAEDYYLKHGVDRSSTKYGALFMQRLNLRDFTDANTVIYGHNYFDGKMFAPLMNFRNRNFFEKNHYIHIYIPGHILTYEIYSAYRTDNHHVLTSYNTDDRSSYWEYLQKTQNPKTTIVNTRDIPLTADSRIITLSTCISNPDYRYLVQGVLVDDCKTL